MSKYFNSKYARELKKFMLYLIKELQAKRVETESVNCPVINRWHRFLGMTLEGTKKSFLEGQDYNIWGLVSWE